MKKENNEEYLKLLQERYPTGSLVLIRSEKEGAVLEERFVVDWSPSGKYVKLDSYWYDPSYVSWAERLR